jgi:lipopolysaccharide/colanic/teichoic acid biosynthesis glycosyltransferase
MIAPRTRGRVFLQSFMDALITFSSFWAYLFIFILLEKGDSRAQVEALGAALIYSLAGLAAVLLQGLSSIYEKPHWWTPNWRESHHLAFSQVTWVGLALCVALAAIGDFDTSRAFLFSWLVLLYFCLLLGNRFFPRKITETVYEGRRERTVILGSMDESHALSSWREYQEKIGGEFFEYIPDFSIADMANLERLMRERHVTQLVLTQMPETRFNLHYVMDICDRVGARLLYFSNLERLFRHRLAVADEGSLQFIGLKDEPLERAHNRLVKRAVDVIGAALFISIVVPLFLLIGLVQRITSAGPLFKTEPRVALKGDLFRIFKFRTGNQDGSSHWFGQFLCRWGIDEWPQILNVLKGEMSLVGPRAHWPEQSEDFARVMRNHYIRSDVKPGITGLAQVRGFRGIPHSEGEIVQRVEADVEYVENWSLGLDMVILWRTCWQGLRGRRAPGSKVDPGV